MFAEISKLSVSKGYLSPVRFFNAYMCDHEPSIPLNFGHLDYKMKTMPVLRYMLCELIFVFEFGIT